MKPVLTPRELAQAIGVSESSVKRWVDDGAIQATKTAGGHRRIPIGEAVRFIRDHQSVLQQPDALGLGDVASIADSFPEPGQQTEALHDYLSVGDDDRVKGLILSLYLNGMSVAEIVDGPLQGAMAALGEIWEHRPEGVFLEHRATEIALQTMSRLRAILPHDPSSPIAVGGAAPEDPYRLASLCAATVLEAAGMVAVNLGANLPIESLEIAIDQLGASLVWVSISSSRIPKSTGPEIRRLAETLESRNTPIVIGGQKVAALQLRSRRNLRVAASMPELEAVAQGMQFSASSSRPN